MCEQREFNILEKIDNAGIWRVLFPVDVPKARAATSYSAFITLVKPVVDLFDCLVILVRCFLAWKLLLPSTLATPTLATPFRLPNSGYP